VSAERPAYDLTIFKLHCGKLTLKIYSKGERVLRIEAVAHNTQELNCGRSLHKFPEVVSRLKGVLERFADALSCIDQCFIADEMLEQLPTASQVGKTIVGGIDLNKPRIRLVVEAVIALSPSPNGFTASDLAARVRALGNDRQAQYGPRHADYDLKKLRGKHIVCRIGQTRHYEPLASGLRAMTRPHRSPQQSHQTFPRRRPTASPSSRRLQPQTHRCPLPYPAACYARRLPRARDRRLRIDKLFVALRPEAVGPQ
jgi:hypothetical protein